LYFDNVNSKAAYLLNYFCLFVLFPLNFSFALRLARSGLEKRCGCGSRAASGTTAPWYSGKATTARRAWNTGGREENIPAEKSAAAFRFGTRDLEEHGNLSGLNVGEELKKSLLWNWKSRCELRYMQPCTTALFQEGVGNDPSAGSCSSRWIKIGEQSNG